MESSRDPCDVSADGPLALSFAKELSFSCTWGAMWFKKRKSKFCGLDLEKLPIAAGV